MAASSLCRRGDHVPSQFTIRELPTSGVSNASSPDAESAVMGNVCDASGEERNQLEGTAPVSPPPSLSTCPVIATSEPWGPLFPLRNTEGAPCIDWLVSSVLCVEVNSSACGCPPLSPEFMFPATYLLPIMSGVVAPCHSPAYQSQL